MLAMMLAVTGQASVVPSAAAAPHTASAATGGTGTGGSFNPLQTRLADTRNGVGGFSTPLPAGAWRAYTVAGIGGIPASGVTSVVVTLTVINSTSAGTLSLAPNTSQPASPVTFLLYDGGDSVSNTGVVDVGTDGKIAVKATSSIDVLIDVQGYFTAGNGTPAPGGYVSANNTRIVNTNTGAGGAIGPLLTGSTTTFTAVGGSTGIPATATAIYANITITTTNTTDNYVTPYATNASRPGTSLNYPGSPTSGAANATALGATIDLNSSGQFNLYIGPGGGSVQVLIDVQGYFDGEPSTSGFTPLNARVFDSRSPSVPVAANSVTSVQVGGVGGIPAGSNSLAGVALNVQVLPGTAGGYLRLWSGDDAEPTSTSNINFAGSNLAGSDRVSNLALVQPSAADGTVKIRNNSATAVNVVLDAEGYLTNPSVLPQAYGTNPTGSGSRNGASMIKRTLTDRSGVQINPINGNLLYSQALLSLAGIGQNASIGLRYNALNDNRPTLNVGLFEAQLYRNGTSNTVTYTAPDGAAYVFTELTGTGSSYVGKNAAGGSATLFRYAKPAGLQADLVRVGSGYGPGTEYDLTLHPSQAVNVYVDNGSNITMNSSQDVTGFNKITYTYGNGGKSALTTITDTQGRTVEFAYTSSNNTTQPSTITDNSLGRTITLTYDSSGTSANGAVTKIVDATGAQTLFTYNATSGLLSKVTDGRGDATSFTYDRSQRLATMITASAAGSAVPATAAGTWTMSYTTSTQTTWTDPNSHATKYNFTLTPLPQVTSVINALTHTQSAAYNSHNDPTSLTNGLTDVTTYGYDTGTNNLNKITSPSGADGTAGTSATFTYTPAGAGTGPYSTADFRPTNVTDAQNNITGLAYNNFGETITIASSNGQGGTRHRTYQGDNTSAAPGPDCGGHTGQLCTSTDGKGNVTNYAYNTAGNLTTMTPPTPLGAHTFTYDAAGRKTAEADGRGHTAYTCYDLDDRITQVSYTTAACATVSGVTYTYDTVGNMTQRVDASGTTTVTYDAMNRALSKTLGSTATSVSYDPADNITGYTDDAGAVAYRYDAANNVQYLSEPGGSCPATPAFPNSTGCIKFEYDNAEHRTVTRLPNGVVNTNTYDPSKRLTKVVAAKGATVIAERDYVYKTAAGADSSLIQTTTDPVAGISNSYTYDHLNRLSTTATGPSSGIATTTSNWTYDLNGNRTQQTITGTGAATTNYGYNAADQLCWRATATGTGCTTPAGGTAYAYDGNGNQTSGANTYSNYDQLASATTVGTQTYAGTTNNERSVAGSSTFVNSILGGVAETVTPYSTQEYVRDPSGTLIAMQVYPSGSTTPTEYYYTADIVGSTIAITNATGANAATYTYDSWGNTTATTGGTFATTTNPWRYAGGYTDPNGTIKLGARYYQAAIGRFTQIDPSRQEQNAYAYTAGNPISRSDSTGLSYDQGPGSGIECSMGGCYATCDYATGEGSCPTDKSNSAACLSAEWSAVAYGFGSIAAYASPWSWGATLATEGALAAGYVSSAYNMQANC